MEWNEKELLNCERRRESRVTKSSLDGRNAFENDYTRIILCSSFRRLQDKAQVFPLDDSDFIRTRLTHSIEVSSIASSIGASIEKQLLDNNNMDIKHKGEVRAILASVGLLHDLGNTPFGHFGELAVQQFFIDFFNKPQNANIVSELSEAEKKDFMHFDGNAHVLRIVSKLQYIRDIYGLNLTYAVLASLLKYPRSSVEGNVDDSIEVSYKKYGYFQSEKDTFNQIVEKTNIIRKDKKVCRHPLVFLMEAADDIAYSVADIEDGIKKGILTIGKVNQILHEFLEYNDDGSKRNIRDEEQKILDILTQQIDDSYPNNDERIIQMLRVSVQSFMIASVVEQFEIEYNDIMEGRFDKELLNVSKAGRIRAAFKRIATIIFADKDIIACELAGDKIINRLLELLVCAVTNKDAKWNLLFEKKNTKERRLYTIISDNYRYIYENHSSQKLYDRLLLVTDFICGMTDYYALNLYQKLNGIII